ncbi:MAG: hypothetical protein AAF975_07230 [Spirochaetota bacterium]
MGNGYAAEFEFSLIEYLRQGLVDYGCKSSGTKGRIPLPQACGDLLQSGSVSLLRSFKEMTEDGTYGRTAKASREKGEKIFLAVLAGFEQLLFDVQKIGRRSG